jgi:protein SCO1/2
MEKWFAVGVTPGENGTLSHSLATAVIGKDGRVVAFYPDKDWAVSDVLGKMEAAAKS